jgi:FkbM family methyltransferase
MLVPVQVTRSIFFSNQVDDTGQVFAIEADPDCFRRLSKTVRMSNLKNVTLINAGVSNENFSGFIREIEKSGKGNYISKSEIENSKRIEVYNFDFLLKLHGIKTIDYMKMNIEGGEVFALLGLNENIQMVKNFCISCHDFVPDSKMHTFSFVSNLLLENDFSIRKHPTDLNSPNKSWYLYARKVEEKDQVIDWTVTASPSIFSERDQARLKCEELSKKVDSLEKELSEMKNSRIWRYSKHYRNAKLLNL